MVMSAAARIDLDLITLGREAVTALDGLYAAARDAVRAKVVKDGKVSSALVDLEQRATHGLAWLATYVESLREMVDYSERLTGEGRFGEIERDIVSIAFGEFLAQVFGGIPMNQGELVRLSDLGVAPETAAAARVPAVETLIAHGNTPAVRAALVAA
jgi:(2S)-methylsuccinyl-CoA dehydrogenase